MGLLSSITDFFALDIGTTAIRVVQLRGSGDTRSLVRYGSIAVDASTTQADSAAKQNQLMEALKKVIHDSKISTRNVVVGIPSNKMFTTVVDIDRVPPKELAKSIKYQADQYIPTSVAESKIDHILLGPSPIHKDKDEVLLASVSNRFSETRLDLLESIGLNVLAMEPDAFALSRSLIPAGSQEAIMILDMGANSTDLILQYKDAPRLVRSIPSGGNNLLKSAQQNLGVDEKQAMQFVYKFGLIENKLEGQVYKALISTVDSLVFEIEKSIKFFSTRYTNIPIRRIVVTGRASILPDFPVYLVNKVNTSVEIGNAWQNVSYPKSSYNDLMAVSNQYAVAAGLAERKL